MTFGISFRAGAVSPSLALCPEREQQVTIFVHCLLT